MIVIFSFSADSGTTSTKKSDSFIVKSCETLLGRKLTSTEKDIYINKFVKLVRKSAHFVLYFLLGLSIISFITEFMILNYKTVLLTIILVFLYAISDEVHQLFVSGRSAEIFDIFIDTLGGIVSSFCYLFIFRPRRVIK